MDVRQGIWELCTFRTFFPTNLKLLQKPSINSFLKAAEIGPDLRLGPVTSQLFEVLQTKRSLRGPPLWTSCDSEIMNVSPAFPL